MVAGVPTRILFVAGALSLALALVAAQLEVMRAFDERAQGLVMSVAARPWNDSVAVVEIDEATLAHHGWPVPRRVQAVVLDALFNAGAKSVTYDLYFSDPDVEDPRYDQLLAFVARSHAVIAPVEPQAGYRKDGTAAPAALAEHEPPGIPTYAPKTFARAVLPTGPLAGSLRLGHALLSPSASGTLRGVPLVVEVAGARVLPIAVVTAMAARDRSPREAGVRGDALDLGGGLVLEGDTQLASLRRVPSSARLSFAEVSAIDAEKQTLPPHIAKWVSGRHVIVGQTAMVIGDHGPLADGRTAPLALLHASLLSDLLEGKPVRELDRGAALLPLIVLALFACGVGARFRPLVGLASIACLVLLVVASAVYLYARHGVLVPLVSALLSSTLPFFGVAIARLALEERERRILKSAFGAYVAPEMLDRLLRDPERFLTPQGTRKRLSILFSDIQGYTTLSGALPPDELLALLRDYLDAMTRIVFRHEGRIDKIMGDGIMAFFGDLVSTSNDAHRAVECALEMQAALERLKREWADKGRTGLVIRIGVATGEVYVGNIGTKEHLEYTVIGTAVNLAARLEAKAPPGGVLVSKETYDDTLDAFEYRAVPDLQLKGISDAYTAYLCAAPATTSDRRRALRVLTNAPATLKIRDAEFPGVVEEVAAGGLSIRVGRHASIGDPIEIRLEPSGREPVTVRGHVQNTRADGGDNILGIAVERTRDGALNELSALFTSEP